MKKKINPDMYESFKEKEMKKRLLEVWNMHMEAEFTCHLHNNWQRKKKQPLQQWRVEDKSLCTACVQTDSKKIYMNLFVPKKKVD